MAEKKKVLPHKCDACGKGWDCGASCEEAAAGKVTTVRCTECQDKAAGIVSGKVYYKHNPAPQTAAQVNAQQQGASQLFNGWANPPAPQEVWTTVTNANTLGQLFSEAIITGNR